MSRDPSRKPVFRVVAKRTVAVFPKFIYQRRPPKTNMRRPFSYALVHRATQIVKNNKELVEQNIGLLDTIKNLKLENNFLQKELLFRDKSHLSNCPQVLKSMHSTLMRTHQEAVKAMETAFEQTWASSVSHIRNAEELIAHSSTSDLEPSPPVATSCRHLKNDEEKENYRRTSFEKHDLKFKWAHGVLTPVAEITNESNMRNLSLQSVSQSQFGSPAESSTAKKASRKSTPEQCSSPFSLPSTFKRSTRRNAVTFDHSLDLEDRLSTSSDGRLSMFRPSFFDENTFLADDSKLEDGTCKRINGSEIPESVNYVNSSTPSISNASGVVRESDIVDETRVRATTSSNCDYTTLASCEGLDESRGPSTGSTRSRRSKKPVSYKEPKIGAKLRRGDPNWCKK